MPAMAAARMSTAAITAIRRRVRRGSRGSRVLLTFGAWTGRGGAGARSFFATGQTVPRPSGGRPANRQPEDVRPVIVAGRVEALALLVEPGRIELRVEDPFLVV